MEDQGIILGTTLGLEYMPHRILIQGVGAQAVDRFRGDAQEPPLPEDLCRFLDFIFPIFWVKYPCFQTEFPLYNISLTN